MAILPVHQMIQTPDILGNFRQGIAFGQQQQERQEKRADQQQLRKLAGSVQQGDPAAYSQAAAIDPEAAGKQLGAGDAMARRAEGLIKMMEQADATNPQQAQALWQSYGVPFARQFSQGSEPTTDWAQAKPMLASLKARIEMAKSAQAGNVQSTQILANGNIGLVTRTGQVIDTGQAASPSTQVINEPGQTPYLVTTGRGAIGQTTAIGPSGQAGVPATAQPAGAPQVTQADMEADIVLANEMIAAGIPEAQVNAFLTQRGQRASAQQPAPMAAPSGAPVAQRNPTAAEVEAQKTAAREQAELGFLPQRGSLEAENAARRVAAEEQARIGFLPQRNAMEVDTARLKAETEANIDRAKTARVKAPQLQNVERGIDRINAALSKLEGGALADTGPLDQYAQQFTKEGQELTAAVGAIQNDMLALTRVPGVGSQSDLEAKIANLKYPALGNHPEVNRRNLLQLQAFVNDLNASISGGGGSMPRPQTQADFDALPSGATYVDPDDGQTYRKP